MGRPHVLITFCRYPFPLEKPSLCGHCLPSTHWPSDAPVALEAAPKDQQSLASLENKVPMNVGHSWRPQPPCPGMGYRNQLMASCPGAQLGLVWGRDVSVGRGVSDDQGWVALLASLSSFPSCTQVGSSFSSIPSVWWEKLGHGPWRSHGGRGAGNSGPDHIRMGAWALKLPPGDPHPRPAKLSI